MISVLLIGEPGTGKSWAGCKLIGALNGEGIVLDSERGTHHYRAGLKFAYPGEPEKPHVTSIEAAHKIVRELLERPVLPGGEPCRLLCIDSITPLWTDLQDQVEARKRAKKGRDQWETSLDQDGWNVINRLNRRFMSDLKRLGMNVIVTAWEKEEWEGRGENRRRVGVKADGQKNLGHSFDLVLRMRKRGGDYWAEVMKNNTGRTLESRIDMPVHELLLKLFPREFEDESEPRPRPTDEQIAEFTDLSVKLKLSHTQLSRAFDERGVSRFEDLSPEAGESILAKLREQPAPQTENQIEA